MLCFAQGGLCDEKLSIMGRQVHGRKSQVHWHGHAAWPCVYLCPELSGPNVFVPLFTLFHFWFLSFLVLSVCFVVLRFGTSDLDM